MNTTINLELAGRLFHFEEAAHRRLAAYLNALRRALDGTEGAAEILTDVEARLVELFDERLAASPGREVLNESDVEWAEGRLGRPEDFVDDAEPGADGPRKLFRDRDQSMLGGVAAGLAAYFVVEVTWVRLAFLLLLTVGFSIPLYIVLWAIIPPATTRADRLAMQGAEPTVDNFRRRVKEELSGVTERVQSGRFREFVARFMAFAGEPARTLVRLVGRFAGLVMVVASLAVLLGAFGLVTGLGGFAWGPLGAPGNGALLDLAKSTLPAGFGMAYAWSALALLCVLPFALVASAIGWLLVPASRGGGRLGWVLALSSLLSLIGLAMAGGVGVRLGMEFQREGSVMHRLDLPPTVEVRALRLEADAALALPMDWVGSDVSWVIDGDRIWMDDVELDILRAADGRGRLEWVTTAHGANRRSARVRAQRIDFEASVRGDSLMFSDGFAFPLDDRYRGQGVRMVLHVPDGERVWIDPALEGWLDHVAHSEGVWGQRLVATEWVMTPQGLASVSGPQAEAE